MSTRAQPPVIIIGMHRSGTSLLTRVLQQTGFFMGIGASRNEEAAFTNAVNAWLFREASATWDRPESLDWLLADESLQPWLVDYMRDMADGPSSLRFLGLQRSLRGWGLSRQQTPWGWKDPRNTFTLPLWLELFPSARVLHIVRHGADVAASLRTRRRDVFNKRTRRYRQYRQMYRMNPFGPGRRGFAPQVRCGTLEGGLDLWALYVTRARQHLQTLGDRGLEISYEALLTEPEGTLDAALRFCGCPLEPAQLAATAASFRPDRAHAWYQNAELREFAQHHRQILQDQGYDSRPDSE